MINPTQTAQCARAARRCPSIAPRSLRPVVALPLTLSQVSSVSTRERVVMMAKKAAAKPAPAAPKGFGKATVAPKNANEGCPCGSMQFYKNCCEQYHSGATLPQDAAATLKSRFSAYKKNQDGYLMATDNRPGQDRDALKRGYVASCEKYEYSRLEVLNVEQAEGSNKALITFNYNSSKRAFDKRMNSRLNRKKAEVELNVDGTQKVYLNRERSEFEKLDNGLWVLVNSEVLEDPVNLTTEGKLEA